MIFLKMDIGPNPHEIIFLILKNYIQKLIIKNKKLFILKNIIREM